jgi:transposase, IS5 family
MIIEFYMIGKSSEGEKAYPPLFLFKCLLFQKWFQIKSVNRPISVEKIDEFKQKFETPEGKLDKNGNPKKYSRDLDSNWVVKNDIPHYGLKEHASVDTVNSFILSTNLSPASHSDSIYLPYAVTYSMHTEDKIQIAYADKGYPGDQTVISLL